jgi:flavin-dependent dehydrogenase
MNFTHDVVIIGGGPAGSTAGALLSRAGKKVLILERDTFPRFHIGESLLPMGNQILMESGVWEKVCAAGFQRKLGAEFRTGNGRLEQRFWFRLGLNAKHTQTFQVERAEFDKVLLDHAATCGCEVRQAATARSVALYDAGLTVTFQTDNGEQTARAAWLIDASGRDTFVGRQLNLPKEPLPLPKRIAVYAHFTGAARLPGEAEGHITIVRLRDGWFWIIPLAHDKTSVGLVRTLETYTALGREPGTAFDQTVAECRVARERLASAQRVSEFYVTSDYTFSHQRLAGARYFLVGDAGTFVDPIFSSGVLIATKTGATAAKMILKAGHTALPAAAQERYSRQVKRMRDIYLRMIQAFYDNDSFAIFMQPVQRLKLVQSVNAILGGNTDWQFGVWWRLELFHLFCRLQRRRSLVRPVDFTESTAPAAP